jgi:hypothetical protein
MKIRPTGATMPKRYSAVLAVAIFAVVSCQSTQPTPVAPAGNAAPAVMAPPAPAQPARDLGVVYGRLNLPSAIIASGGGNIIAAGGGNIIAAGGGNIIAAGGGNIIAAGGGNIIAAGGGNIIAAGGGNIIAAGGGNIIASGGGNLVAAGGGNIIAAGGGNIIAAGGGNYHPLSVESDVIDALTVTPSSLVNPLIDAGQSHPVAHAALMLTDADGHQLPNTPYAVTDDQGYYYFVGLPADRPYIVTAPFLPSRALIAAGGGNIIAAGGGNIIAAGGGNIIAAGGGNIIAAGGGNVVSPNGSTVVSPNGGTLKSFGGWQLLADAATSGAAAAAAPAATVASQVLKASPKALSQTQNGATFQARSGSDGLANVQQQIAGLLAQLKPSGQTSTGTYATLAQDANVPAVNGTQTQSPDNGDINIASTVTSNLLLAAQKGKLATLDQAKFNLVSNRIAGALLSANLVDISQSVPEVPKLVAISKLELPPESSQLFDKSDAKLAQLLLAEADKRKQIVDLLGEAKQKAQTDLAALEAQAKDANDQKIAALFGLADQLLKKLDISVTTDNTPVGGGGNSTGTSGTGSTSTGDTSTGTTPTTVANPTQATNAGQTTSGSSGGGGSGGGSSGGGSSTTQTNTPPAANGTISVQNGGVTDPAATEAVN